MDIFPRRGPLLTREEIVAYIASAALEGLHEKATEVVYPVPEIHEELDSQHKQRQELLADQETPREKPTTESTLQDRTFLAASQAVQELAIGQEDLAVARGVIAQQAVLAQAVSLYEARAQRKLTVQERAVLCRALPALLKHEDSSSHSAPSTNPVRGPRTIRDAWGH